MAWRRHCGGGGGAAPTKPAQSSMLRRRLLFHLVTKTGELASLSTTDHPIVLILFLLFIFVKSFGFLDHPILLFFTVVCFSKVLGSRGHRLLQIRNLFILNLYQTTKIGKTAFLSTTNCNNFFVCLIAYKVVLSS